MQITEEINDADLFRLIKQENTSAFRILYDRYWKELYLKACKRVDEETAKDIIQDIMTTLWRRKEAIELHNNSGVAAYLHTALKYRIISYYAYTASEIRKTAFFNIPVKLSLPDTLEVKELGELIELEVSKLPARMQQIFRMSREDEISIADIARQLNISEQTVKNQLTEALKRLRVAIQSKTSSDWVLIVTFMFYQINR